jgi:hypothetical protein
VPVLTHQTIHITYLVPHLTPRQLKPLQKRSSKHPAFIGADFLHHIHTQPSLRPRPWLICKCIYTSVLPPTRTTSQPPSLIYIDTSSTLYFYYKMTTPITCTFTPDCYRSHTVLFHSVRMSRVTADF